MSLPEPLPAANPADHQKRFSAYVRMYRADTGKEIEYLNYSDKNATAPGTAHLDFSKIAVNTAVATYAAQEAADGSDFAPARSVFSIAHLTPEMLLRVGEPIGSHPSYFVVIPPAVAPGANSTARAAHTDRKYIGLAVDIATGAFYAFRAADATYSVVDVLVRGKAKEIFARYYDDEVLRATVVAAKNKRAVSFLLPYSDGVRVAMNIPYVPTAMYSALYAAHKKDKAGAAAPGAPATLAVAAEASASIAAAAPLATLAAAAPLALAAAEAPPVAKAPSRVDAVLATLAMDDDDDEDDEDEEKVPAAKKPRPAPAPVVAAPVADVSIVEAAKRVKHLSPVQTKENALLLGSAEKRAAAGAAAAGLRRITFVVPAAPRALQRTDRVTFASLMAHLAHKFPPGTPAPDIFSNLATFDAMLYDDTARTALYHFAAVMCHFAPHALGRAPDPAIPESVPLVTLKDLA